MFELDDCGKEFHLTFDLTKDTWKHDANLVVQMIIKAPRGIMVLFDQKYISPDTQCKAIKAFMEEHRND